MIFMLSPTAKLPACFVHKFQPTNTAFFQLGSAPQPRRWPALKVLSVLRGSWPDSAVAWLMVVTCAWSVNQLALATLGCQVASHSKCRRPSRELSLPMH